MTETGSWYSLALGDALTAHLPLARILEAFDCRFPRATCPAGAAVFSRHDLEGRLHCEVNVFFSPAASALAIDFHARPCARPSRAGLQLLAGDPGLLDAC